MNHRGGRPGFVRVQGGRTCVIPDYSGNRMMQSLGNVDATPLASLTFFDFVSGDILYITGNAKNIVGPDAQSIMPRINVVTTVETTGYVFVKNALAVRQKPGSGIERSPYSPPIRFLAEETHASDVSLDDVSVTLTRIKLHTSNVATFTFTSSQPVAIKPGQHAIIDLTAFSGKEAYQHMAHEGLEASLNDDCTRTWTVSSSHSSHTQTFDLTMKEKRHGAITGKLFNIARTLSERRPELMENTAPLGITVGLVGIGGQFTLPTNSSKLLLVAGGIGITPFLSMLNSVATSEAEETWDIILIISTREPRLAAQLISTALGPDPQTKVRLTLHIFTSQTLPSLDFQATLHAGRPNLPFYRSIQYLQDRTIFVCGPTAFEETVIQGLQGAGADSESILRENFAY
jgi:ferredoxin-NADP reductase